MNDKDYTLLTDRELVDAVCDHVSASAVFSSRGFNRYAQEHDEACRQLYAEAVRRGKENLYEQGYKKASR